MKATNIKWDTDGNKEVLKSLPEEMEIPSGMYDLADVSDYLSDKTEWCHGGFSVVYDKKDVKNYLETHLEEHDLEKIEINEKDIGVVLRDANRFQDLEYAADVYLSSMREALDWKQK